MKMNAIKEIVDDIRQGFGGDDRDMQVYYDTMRDFSNDGHNFYADGTPENKGLMTANTTDLLPLGRTRVPYLSITGKLFHTRILCAVCLTREYYLR